MKQFHCQCGQSVFFDSDLCLNCGSRLGFDPRSLRMEALRPESGHWLTAQGEAVQFCANGVDYDVCNWILPVTDGHPLCRGCRFNRTVPNQSLPGNQQRWRRLEEGKKRLLYTLMQLGLPLENGWDSPPTGLLFDFIEDERGDGLLVESFVNTGYLGGIITINTLEADDVERENQRARLNENYRTLLGHLRHESGHYYWQRLQPDDTTRLEFNAVFGDEGLDYGEALARYYENGPARDWHHNYISAYASAHPVEDWAESWGHYLHIYDALETAATHKLNDTDPAQMTLPERIAVWRELTVSLNELNRSLGRPDAYPFLINAAVERKLAFVDNVIRQLRTPAPGTAGH